MAWTNIPNANLAIGSPVRSVDLLAIRDNIPAIANGDTGAPKIQNSAYGAGTITPDKLSGGQSGSAPAFVSRAWVNYNGTGTVSIRGSGNVSSITDYGTGNYGVNFITPMQDANYCVNVSGSENITTDEPNGSYFYGIRRCADPITTGYCRVAFGGSSQSGDSVIGCVSVYR